MVSYVEIREPSILSLKTFSNLQLCLFVGFGEISQGNDFTNWYCTNIRGKKNFYFVLTCYKACLSVYTNSLKNVIFLKIQNAFSILFLSFFFLIVRELLSFSRKKKYFNFLQSFFTVYTNSF